MVNTHAAGEGPHYHSDLCYAFVAADKPTKMPSDGESSDLRWMTIEEMQAENDASVLDNVIQIYTYILKDQSSFIAVPANEYSLEKPKIIAVFDNQC